jgi:CubicO group peptidase (beta-lactamase class C family)
MCLALPLLLSKTIKSFSPKVTAVRELGKTERVDENTLFAIASNSKAFTTASLAILVDERN